MGYCDGEESKGNAWRAVHLSESASEAPREDDSDLLALLDFTQLDTRPAIPARFATIADTLLHRYRIEITTSSKVEQLELLEIEFYLYKSGCHEDPFTHGSAEQSQAGNWCVVYDAVTSGSST